MPELPAVASSPIAFSSAEGQYFLIPLNAVYFDANGTLKADRWPLYGSHSAIVDPLLTTLRSAGVLVPGPVPPQQPAFTATAKTVGGSAVLIAIDIANVVANAGSPPASTADVTVTETDTYLALAPDTLVETIGDAANGGTRPSIVFVSGGAAPELPAAGTYPMAAAAAGDPATADIPKHSGAAGAAFTVQTRAGTADAIRTSIEIKDVSLALNTFTLVVKWTKTQNALAMTGMNAAFTYVIDVTAPAGGFLAPAAGTTHLTGGSDAVAVDPVKASAVILSK